MLSGYKTYLCGIAGLIVIGMQSMGWITNEQTTFFLEILGAGGLMSLRHALSK
jgi:hypothetical protein